MEKIRNELIVVKFELNLLYINNDFYNVDVLYLLSRKCTAIEQLSVAEEENGRVTCGSFWSKTILRELNNVISLLYKMARRNDLFIDALLNVVSARKYFLFPGMMDL